jgi:hypothetical protein
MERLIQMRKFLLLSCGLAAVLGINAAPILAQTTASPLDGTQSADQDLNNIFSNRDQGASSLFGLINKIQLLNGRNPNDFAAEQDENFQSAVSDFRKKQQQKVQAPVSPAPALSTPSPLP